MKSLFCIVALIASPAHEPQLNQTMSHEGVATVAPTSSLLTASSPWYKWQYKVDGNLTGTTACSQAMRGSWQQISGPFKDQRCEIHGLPD